MEQEKQTHTHQIDPEKTLVSPRFDEDAVSHARPAVPLGSVADAPPGGSFRQAVSELRSSRPALALVLVSMLASGVIGALATMLYHRPAALEETPAAAVEASSDATARTDVPADYASEQVAPQNVSERQVSVEQQGATRQQRAPVAEAEKRAPLVSGRDQEEGQDAGTLMSQQEREIQHSSLRDALNGWIATTNARDINRQRDFYMPKVNAFYRARNVSREAVLADKGRAFENADLIDVRAGQPEITLDRDGRTATMRFRKQYAERRGQQDRRGEVVQELRWRRTGRGWKIMSERDVKVIQ